MLARQRPTGHTADGLSVKPTMDRRRCAIWVSIFFIPFFLTVLSFLPTKTDCLKLPTKTATSTLCKVLSRSLDSLCPLTYKPTKPVSFSPWLSDIPWSERATHSCLWGKWRKSNLPTDLAKYCTACLLVFFCCNNLQRVFT